MKQIRIRMARGGLRCALLCWSAFALAGCGIRTIYVPHGEPVRLRQTLRKAKIWAADAKGKEVPGEMDLPEGWYVLSKD